MIVRAHVIAAGCGLALAGAAAMAAFAAPKPVPAPAPAPQTARVCFRVGQVDGVAVSSPIGPKKQDAVNIRVLNRDFYQIVLQTSCPELQNSVKIGIESRSGTGTVCGPTDAVVVARDEANGNRRECWAETVHKLTPQEVAAIPQKGTALAINIVWNANRRPC